MVFGKVIGGLIGFFSAGPIGAIAGVLVGHFFDQSLNKFQLGVSSEALQAIQINFFSTTFTLIGYLAKSDGVVTQEEIDETQQLMEKMGLTADHKREAIRLFKIGADPDFNPAETLDIFRSTCGNRQQLVNMLMVYLINTAMADNELHTNEEKNLRYIAQSLNFSHAAFEQLLNMIRAQGSFAGGGYHQQQSQRPQANEIEEAYAALGVNPSTSDRDIKKAYRKLMSEYHPDKLIGQGVPDDMVKMATERSQEVQTAYDIIKKARKNS